MDRRALRPDPERSARGRATVAGVDVEADRDLRRPAADRRLDQVEVRLGVEHQRRRGLGSRGRELDQAPHRLAIDRGVGDHDVIESQLGEVKGLGEREARGCRGSPRRARRSGAASPTDRTDFEAIRIGRSAGLGAHRSGVGGERVEVDERERRLDRLEDRLVALEERLAVDWRRRGGSGVGRAVNAGASVSRIGAVRPGPCFRPRPRRGGRVAEGTRLLSE